ncbi:MAG: cob(I)yrinic acid a,c-diamide adenosyltransferase [Prevotella sp.]|nr:cob(I)yrinic acid a,c-diamide adenosyltransferase [Prevotella sp.]
MRKITKVYTRRGDKGQTSLVGGQRVSKDCVRIEAYGTVDELNAQLGLLAALLEAGEPELRAQVLRIQNTLFNVCTHLATDLSQTQPYASGQLPEGEVAWLEQQVDAITHSLSEPQGFILSGGTHAAAQAHVCRTVCRRAERRIVTLAAEAEVYPEMQQFVNRLSDYLFVLAKKINFNAGRSEILWENACK